MICDGLAGVLKNWTLKPFLGKKAKRVLHQQRMLLQGKGEHSIIFIVSYLTSNLGAPRSYSYTCSFTSFLPSTSYS